MAFAEVLTPIVKAYCSDIGFRVTETAMQCYGGYGFCCEYPVEQFIRDEKIASIYEGANGIQALDLIGRKLGMKKGAYFMNLLGEMNTTVTKYKDLTGNADMAADVQNAVNKLAEMGMFLASCAKQGKFLVPVNNAYPVPHDDGQGRFWLVPPLAGRRCTAEARCAAKEKGIDEKDKTAIAQLMQGEQGRRLLFRQDIFGQVFAKNVLPEVDAAAVAIKTEDMSILEIPEESFCSY